MSKKIAASAFAVLLTITLVAPAALFVAPQKASASATSCIGALIGGLAGSLFGGSGGGQEVPSNDAQDIDTNNGTKGATIGSCINDVILIPLARAEMRKLLQNITASVIVWINGGNGTGQPSYVQNLSVHLQGVGDAAAFSFIGNTATAFNSPFGPSISSSLQTNYLQKTSMAGFYAANQCTLNSASPNIKSYLAGNWSQGGVGAWFALTTQPQNNPYTLYQAAQTQVSSNVSEAQTNRRQDLAQSQGFLSWCPASSNTKNSISTKGISPSAPCTNPDGSPAQAQTPGSVIHDYTQQAVVNSGFQQVVSATDLDDALTSIMTALVNQVIGPNGLLGGVTASYNRPSLTSQLQNYSSDNSGVKSAYSQAQTVLAQISGYTDALNIILTATNAASSTVLSLNGTLTSLLAANTASSTDPTVVSCNTQLAGPNGLPASNTSPVAINAQVNADQTVLTNVINPTLQQLQATFDALLTTKALALKVQTEASATISGTAKAGTGGSLSADVQALSAVPISTADVAAAQKNAQVSGGATASPKGSLTASGGTLLDRMNLVSTNAAALKSACTAATTTPAT